MHDDLRERSGAFVKFPVKGFHNGLTVLRGHLSLQFGQNRSRLRLAVRRGHLRGLQSLQGGGLAAVLKGGQLHGKNESLLELQRVVLLIQTVILLLPALQERFEGRNL